MNRGVSKTRAGVTAVDAPRPRVLAGGCCAATAPAMHNRIDDNRMNRFIFIYSISSRAERMATLTAKCLISNPASWAPRLGPWKLEQRARVAAH